MATFTANTPINMSEEGTVWYGDVVEYTATYIKIVNGGLVQEYFGTGFQYSDDGVTSGILTGTKNYENGVLQYSISGLNVSAVLAQAYINSGDWTSFSNAAFSGNDSIIGSSGADVLLPFGGGNDTLTGGLGNDTLTGGAGVDTANYSTSTAAVVVSLAAGTATGGAGSDTLSGIENVTGSNYNDTLTGDAYANILLGGTGVDSLVGGDGADILIGGVGNDTLDGGTNSMMFETRNFVDVASYLDASSGILANLSSSSYGGVAAGIVSDGDGGTDTLSNIQGIVGTAYDDIVVSGSTMICYFDRGTGGNDTFVGSESTYDILSFQHTTAQVSLDIADLTATAGGDTIHFNSNVDEFFGGSAGDHFSDSRTGTDLDGYTFLGGWGDDTISGSTYCYDTVNYGNSDHGVIVNLGSSSYAYSDPSHYGNGTLLAGHALDGLGGTDTLSYISDVIGSMHTDTIIGGNNIDNWIQGLEGDDILSGGTGGERGDWASYCDNPTGVIVNLSSATQYGVAAGHAQDGWGDTDTLTGFEHAEGSSFADTLIGGDSGEDLLNGLSLLMGREGNDLLVDGSSDSMSGACYAEDNNGVIVNLSGTTQYGVAAQHALDGNGDTDTFINIFNAVGSDQNDTIIGSSGNNILFGQGGNDLITAGAGNDVLCGGKGVDTLTGGAGNDIFLYTKSSTSHLGDSTDFTTSTDTFAFTNDSFTYTTTATAQAHVYTSAAGYQGSSGNSASWYYDATTHTLNYDSDGYSGTNVSQTVATGVNTNGESFSTSDVVIVDAHTFHGV